MIQYSRKFGDRYDGYRVKNVDPFFFIIPQVMSKRVDSQVYFSEEVDITALEQFVREHTNTDIPGLKMYHVLIASYNSLRYLWRLSATVTGKKPQRSKFLLTPRILYRM